MHPKALVGLVRSHMAYERDWPELVAAKEEGADDVTNPLRVFDLSPVLVDENREVKIDFPTVGRHLPFPLFAVVGTGHGVFVVVSDPDQPNLYAYCYTSPVPLLVVTFTLTGWTHVGVQVDLDGEKVRVVNEQTVQFSSALATLLTLVEEACANTRHVVSYRLNRNERRAVAREVGEDRLSGTIVHHVALNLTAKEQMIRQRGETVVPTPKRLHEVRAHWRHLRSGLITRVRSHRRGKRGDLAPRVYSVKGEKTP